MIIKTPTAPARLVTGMAAILLAIGARPVRAGEISDEVLVVTAVNASGAASYVVSFDPAYFDPATGTYDWVAPAPIVLTAPGGAPVARIEGLSTTLHVDPVISVNFLLSAGSSDTTFTISSAVLSFDPISNAAGGSSAQVGLTDLNGNGVSLVGGQAGGSKSYRAEYNGPGAGTQVFAELVDNLSSGAWGSDADSEVYPTGGGMALIAGPVSSMQAQFAFTLTAGDRVSGTSVYVIVPEPTGVAALIVLGLLAAGRR